MNSRNTAVGDVLGTFDYVHDRIMARLEGLSEREYLWEPVADCWTLREGPDGLFRADAVPDVEPVPAPVTTIAWRMWHIGSDCLLGYCERYLNDPRPEPDPCIWPGTAAAGITALEAGWSRFRRDVEGLGDEGLLEAMGPHAGLYAKDSYLTLVLHALDEVAHHGAELGLLRDLYLHGFTI
jgi:hypothetical protein